MCWTPERLSRWRQRGAGLFFAVLILPLTAPAGAADEAIMATLAPQGSPAAPIHAEFLETFENTSSGDVRITPFFAGELGPEEKYFGDLRRGRVQLAVVSSHGVSTAIPEFSMMRAPFLFDSVDEYIYVFETQLQPLLESLLADKGLVLFSWMVSGWDGLYAQTPILSPADVVGVRVRIPIEPSAPIVFQTLKADVIHIPFTDVITGLQTGLIEAGETTPSAYLSAGLWAEAPHFTHTNHSLTTAFGLANAAWFENLSLQDQTALQSSYAAAGDIYARMTRTIDANLSDLEADGRLHAHTPTADQRRQWQAVTEPAFAVMTDVLGGRSSDVLAAIMAGKQAYTATTDQ